MVILLGSEILKEIIRKTDAERLNICYNILGIFSYPEYEKSVFLKSYGKYKHDKLDEVFGNSIIDVFLYLSICPETFGYVIYKIMLTQKPIFAFNLGSLGQALHSYPKAILINNVCADKMFGEIKKMYNHHLEKIYPVFKYV